MEPFVRKVQPSRVEAWKEGRDFALHPEDPWYVRRCLQDAIARLLREEISMSEFEKVKRELRRKRQIPIWFKERFNLDYDDQIALKSANSRENKEEEGSRELTMEGPRVRQARHRLREKIGRGGKCCKVSTNTECHTPILDQQTICRWVLESSTMVLSRSTNLSWTLTSRCWRKKTAGCRRRERRFRRRSNQGEQGRAPLKGSASPV